MKWRSRFFATSLLAILMAATALPMHAGWIEINNDGEKNLMSKGLFKNSMQGEDTWSTMDMNKGTLTLVSSKRKTYSTGTMKEFCQMMSAMQKKMMASMEQAMAGMTPEQKAMMEQMMGKGAKRPDPKVSIARAGNGGVIAGFKTTKYTVSVDGRPHKEIWLTANSALMKDLKPYLDKILAMSDMSRCGMGGGGMMEGEFDVENSDEYKKLMHKGYPLREKDIPDLTGQVVTHPLKEVTSLVQKSIPASAFAVPRGYKKMSFSEMMQFEMGGRDR